MSFLHAIRVALILSLFPTASIAHATKPATMRSTEAILTKANLDKIKRFMLKRGETCTRTNMYNNNPCIATENFSFYLNPDPGGPHNHFQWNSNCDPTKGDFNTLVVSAIGKAGEEIDEHSRYIHFKDAHKIKYDVDYAARYKGPRMSKTELRRFPERAVKELLTLIEQHENHAPSNAP